jgi:hypothetical protein
VAETGDCPVGSAGDLEANREPVNKLTSMLQLEAQIYGRLDLTHDVAQIVVAPNVGDAVRKDAKKFCKRHKIAYMEIAPDDLTIKSALSGGLGGGDLAGKSF